MELEEEDSVEVVWEGPRNALPKVNLNVFRGAVFLPPLSEYGLFGLVFTIRIYTGRLERSKIALYNFKRHRCRQAFRFKIFDIYLVFLRKKH